MKNTTFKMARAATRSKRFRIVVLTLLTLWLLAGVGIVWFEFGAVDGNIQNYEDGLWWSVTTLTAVGYGDLYPVTMMGRVLGAGLEVFGVVLFGSVIAMVSISFLRYQEDYYVRRMVRRIDGIEEKLDEMLKHIDYVVKDRVDK